MSSAVNEILYSGKKKAAFCESGICGEEFEEFLNQRVGEVCPNFIEKTFIGGYQTMEFVKVSPLKVPAAW